MSFRSLRGNESSEAANHKSDNPKLEELRVVAASQLAASSPASDASLLAASLRVVCFRLLPCSQRDHLSLRLDARQLAGSVAFGTRRRQFQSGLYSGSPGLYEEILTAVPVEHKHSVIPCLAGD